MDGRWAADGLACAVRWGCALSHALGRCCMRAALVHAEEGHRLHPAHRLAPESVCGRSTHACSDAAGQVHLYACGPPSPAMQAAPYDQFLSADYSPVTHDLAQ